MKVESWDWGDAGCAEKIEDEASQGALDPRNAHSAFLMGVGLSFLVTTDCFNLDFH